MTKQIENLTGSVRQPKQKPLASSNSYDFSDVAEQMATLKSILFDSTTDNELKIQIIQE